MLARIAPALLVLLAAAAPRVAPDPLERLHRWTVRFDAGQIEWDGAEEDRVAALCRDVLALEEQEPERAREARLAVLDLAGHALARPGARPLVLQDPSQAASDPPARLRRIARQALETHFEHRPDELGGLLSRDVLIRAEEHDEARRLAALDLLRRHPAPGAELAVLTVAQDRGDPLRPASLRALGSWSSVAVDRFLVDNLERPWDRRLDPHPFRLIQERLAEVRPLSGANRERLVRRAAAWCVDADWRRASMGIELLGHAPAELAVPTWIEALRVWLGRSEGGLGSRRIEHELAGALEALSGRSIGPHPDRWLTWWNAVQDGQVPLSNGELGAGGRSTATFFGLRPVSDRVTFVIDRSGSMDGRWGSGEHSRYDEAVVQLQRYLEASGERTRFNVVLFSDDAILSSRSLVPATAENIASAATSLLARTPDGGTHLRHGIELAAALDRGGNAQLELLEADTIIVLCDGDTSQGRGWVPGFLERVNPEARLVFHCVMLASGGDGTLEALAEGTGGQFVRVGG